VKCSGAQGLGQGSTVALCMNCCNGGPTDRQTDRKRPSPFARIIACCCEPNNAGQRSVALRLRFRLPAFVEVDSYHGRPQLVGKLATGLPFQFCLFDGTPGVRGTLSTTERPVALSGNL
jgi:hypothetical protein